MLSRRSVRVKVMQVLYAQDRDKDLSDKEVLKMYNQSVDMTFSIFLFNLYLIVEIAKISMEDEAKRVSKYIVSDDDKLFKSTLYNNDVILGIAKNEDIRSRFEKENFASKVDEDIIKKLYKSFSQQEEYIKYWHNRKSLQDDKNILLEFYRFLRSSEVFNELIEESYYQWLSEKSVVVGAVKKVLKQDDFSDDFITEYYPTDATVKGFGYFLLEKTLGIEKELEKYVIPKLLKWDKDRVAGVDMVFIEMSLAEILYFSTIPCNVTLNEYVELSKSYSTDKSKEFINGVMDSVVRDLKEQGIINKSV